MKKFTSAPALNAMQRRPAVSMPGGGGNATSAPLGSIICMHTLKVCML